MSIEEGVIMTRKKYIADLLKKNNMEHCKPVVTPMASFEKLSKDYGVPLSIEEGSRYISTVGALQYLTMTKANILFVINRVC